jgi:hypothetical protein
MATTAKAQQYAELDKLTKEQVTRIKAKTAAAGRRATTAKVRAAGPRAEGVAKLEGAAKQIIIAEGDSWFNFPPGVDLIDHLANQHGFKIENAGCFGDTLTNMVYGEKDRYARESPQAEGHSVFRRRQ